MTNRKYTKQELKKLHWRGIWHMQIGWNYERMQGLGYLTTMLPVLEDSYGDNPELMQKALRTHAQFFNTQPSMADIIVGMNIALEEEANGEDVIETAAAIKTSLMGPFAGIGDTVFGMIAGTIFGSLAVTFSTEGSYIGLILLTLWSLAVLFIIRPIFFDLGYRQGTNLVTTLGGQLNAFTDAASVLGITVIGGMIASMVNLQFGGIRTGTQAMKDVVDEAGEVVGQAPDYFVNLQTDLFDKIMPKFGSVILVAVAYWLLGKEGMNSNKLIMGTIVLCLLLAALGQYTPVEILV